MSGHIIWRYNPDKANDILHDRSINGLISRAFARHKYRVNNVQKIRNFDDDNERYPYVLNITLDPEDMLIFTLASGDNGGEVLETFQELAKREFMVLNKERRRNV